MTSYVWRTDSEGVLSTQASFTRTAASLHVGTYPIYFKARDSNNNWSDEISRTITIQAPGATQKQVYLPAVLRDFVSYFPGPFEIEPNNTAGQANGPLQSGVDYHGYQNDDKDYFSFYLPSSANITADLSNTSGQGTQLLLYYQIADVAHRVDFVAGSPFHIFQSNRPSGWYYLEVFTASGMNSDTPYTLRVTYP